MVNNYNDNNMKNNNNERFEEQQHERTTNEKKNTKKGEQHIKYTTGDREKRETTTKHNNTHRTTNKTTNNKTTEYSNHLLLDISTEKIRSNIIQNSFIFLPNFYLMLAAKRLPEILQGALYDGIEGVVLMTVEGSLISSAFTDNSVVNETGLAAIASTAWGNYAQGIIH